MGLKPEEIPILMYHEIADQDNDWCVSPVNFAKQMQSLQENGYETISLSRLQQLIKNNKELTQKYAAITFDDARKGVYIYAYPILKKYQFTATVYVVPQWIESKNIPFTENYSPFLTWEELKELSDHGFEIGSHSYSHQNLVNLSKEELISELEESKGILQTKLNCKIRHFCYPFGKFDHKVELEINKRFKTAVTTEKGFAKRENAYARQWILKNTSLEQFQKLLQKPTISLCMIVKDEADCLEQCLSSVQGLVDEIIIVDTGSSDQTKEIAAKFTDKVFDFSWCDDFAAARNESLRYANSDWILILDADEMIDEESLSIIRQAVNEVDVSGFRITTRNYVNDSSIQNWQPCLIKNSCNRSFQGWVPSIKVRLFQRKDHIKFSGKIHEMIDEKILFPIGKLVNLRVFIHHYGFNQGNFSKIDGYLQLTKKKIEENPRNAKSYFELGVQFKDKGEFGLAEEVFKQSLKLEPNSVIPLLNLAIVQQKQGKVEQAIDSFNTVLERKKSADAYFGLGFCYFKKGELDQSIHFFKKTIEQNPLFVNAYINLGAIYEKKGNYNKAIEVLKKVIPVVPDNARAHYNLGVAYEKSLYLGLAIRSYQKAIELNYARKQELKVKIEKIKEFMAKPRNTVK